MYKKINKGMSGYLTVYLSMILAVLLPLCFVLIEGVRINAIYFESECIANIGVNSVFAEYHRELLNQYNIFAIDSSYGTDLAAKTNTEQHLKNYMNCNMNMDDVFLSDFAYKDFLGLSTGDVEISGLAFLTDHDGKVFRQCAVKAIEDDIGITFIEKIKDWVTVVESNNFHVTNIEEEKEALDREIEEKVEEAHSKKKTKEVKNKDGTIEIVEESYEPYISPTQGLDQIRHNGILNYVISNPDTLSNKSINLSGLLISRMEQSRINKGNMPFDEGGAVNEIYERIMFDEYLLKYFGRYGDEDTSNALEYQVEYLVEGRASDIENLRSMANRLCLLRSAANTAYIYTDDIKCAEANIIAAAIALLVEAPDIQKPLKNSILLGWAFAESMYDVKTLLNGGTVPLLKDENTWHYSLQSALGLNTFESGGRNDGLEYIDYLRIFLFLANQDDTTKRAMTLIEADIRQTDGNSRFRLDGCIESAEFYIKTESAYGYSYDFNCKKTY